jgi:DNA-binding MarR family transcriptional regulator
MAKAQRRSGETRSEHPDLLAATGHLLRRAMQQYTASWAAAMPEGLTSPQFVVLVLLAAEQPLDQQTIGERGALDKSTCGHLIDRMHRNGLVDARIDPGNRRRKMISLTARGRELFERAVPVQREVNQAVLARLTEPERTQLNRLLHILLGVPVRDQDSGVAATGGDGRQ